VYVIPHGQALFVIKVWLHSTSYFTRTTLNEQGSLDWMTWSVGNLTFYMQMMGVAMVDNRAHSVFFMEDSSLLRHASLLELCTYDITTIFIVFFFTFTCLLIMFP
jgi:hypothetical protein